MGGTVAKMTGDGVGLLPRAVVQGVESLGREGGDGLIHAEAVAAANLLEERTVPALRIQSLEAVDLDRSLPQGHFGVGNELFHGDPLHIADTRTMGTSTGGIIEGKDTRLQLAEGDTMLLTSVGLGKGQLLLGFISAGDSQDGETTLGGGQGVLHRIGQARADALLHDQTVYHDLDAVLFILVQLDVLGQIVDASVHANTNVTLFLGIGQHLLVHTLLGSDHRRQHHEAGAIGELQNAVYDLVNGLLTDLLAAHGTMGNTHTGVEEAKIVVDLGDRAHGGAGVLGGGLLVNGDGRGQSLDEIHVGLVHLTQKHAGVGGQGLHESAVSLGVDGIKGQRGFTRSRKSRHDHQLVAGDGDVHILQIMHAGALYDDGCLHTDMDSFFQR